jgi:hypothetical protein
MRTAPQRSATRAWLQHPERRDPNARDFTNHRALPSPGAPGPREGDRDQDPKRNGLAIIIALSSLAGAGRSDSL